MVQLDVEGLLSLSPNVLKATLGVKCSEIVCGFCFKTESHVHSVYGTILFNPSECCVELECQDDGTPNSPDVKCISEEINDISNGVMTVDDSDNNTLYFFQSEIGEPVECEVESSEIDTSMPTSSSNFYEADHEAVDYISIKKEIIEGKDLLNNPPKKIHELKKVDFFNGQKCQGFLEELQSKNVIRKHVNKKPQNEYICEVCSYSFSRKTRLRLHRASIHGLDVERIVCEICGNISPTTEHHAYHMRSKHSEQSSICPHCGKAFSHKKTLNKHIKYHLNLPSEPMAVCEICGVKIRKSCMNDHTRRHTDKQYVNQCQKCGLVCSSLKKLRKHRNTHRFVVMFKKNENGNT
ncbi:zinc finger protein 718-like [Artemia franciscana]|uniref:C2H2-type domain-containing protein n=1 Tax=Artemia franciscana TaxID=6661 RepID=A0AA88H7M4_ARTSF|nr:hypothetical protein QYM36_017248 [Artemia franciscana]